MDQSYLVFNNKDTKSSALFKAVFNVISMHHPSLIASFTFDSSTRQIGHVFQSGDMKRQLHQWCKVEPNKEGTIADSKICISPNPHIGGQHSTGLHKPDPRSHMTNNILHLYGSLLI